MSDEMEELPPWRPVRWGTAVVLILLLHLGGIYLLSGVGLPEPVPSRRDFAVKLLTLPDSGQTLLDRYSLRDPTLFAVVSSRGFSGPAWLNVEPPPFELPTWSDPQRWMTQDLDGLGLTFRRAVEGELGSMLSVAPRPEPPRDEPRPVASRRTELFVEGLPTRRLAARPELPGWPSEYVLHPTEIEIFVDARGRVFSPRLLVHPERDLGVGDEGWRATQTAADQHALALTRRLRFEPVVGRRDQFSKGRVIVQWVTRPPGTPAPGGEKKP